MAMTELDELIEVSKLRADVRLGGELAKAERVLMAEIRRQSGVKSSCPRPRAQAIRPRLIMIGAAVAAAGIATMVVAPWPATTPGSHTRPVNPGQRSPVATPVFHSKADLVTHAIMAAAATTSFNPRPHQWTFMKWLVAAPAHKRVTQEFWIRVDRRELALSQDGKVVFNPNVGEVEGWPRVTYRYLNSLPVAPAKLEAVIAANLSTPAQARSSGVAQYGLDQAIFQAVQALMENVVVPPALLGGLYGVLGELRSVRFQRSVTDVAGRTGVGLYMIIEGYLKLELIINPRTFALMGVDAIAVRAHTSVGTDVTVHYRKGQVVSLAAIWLGIVSRAGELP